MQFSLSVGYHLPVCAHSCNLQFAVYSILLLVCWSICLCDYEQRLSRANDHEYQQKIIEPQTIESRLADPVTSIVDAQRSSASRLLPSLVLVVQQPRKMRRDSASTLFVRRDRFDFVQNQNVMLLNVIRRLQTFRLTRAKLLGGLIAVYIRQDL